VLPNADAANWGNIELAARIPHNVPLSKVYSFTGFENIVRVCQMFYATPHDSDL